MWKEWCPLDTAIGAWLLDPDRTPSSFSELLARYGMQQMAPPMRGAEGDWNSSALQQDLALLGPLMVKIYRQLQVRACREAYIALKKMQCSRLSCMLLSKYLPRSRMHSVCAYSVDCVLLYRVRNCCPCFLMLKAS